MSLVMQRTIRKHDVGDRAIFVVDGLFDEQFIRMIYPFMNRLPFALSDYDTEQTKHALHWKHEFDLQKLPPMPLIPELISRTVEASNEFYSSTKLRLKRMHCNMHLYGDVQHPHTDLANGVTAVYFANPHWETNWMGETIFYNDDGEPLYAVLPKPGRLAVFNGEILHRGGVPSRECFEARISIAFKFGTEMVQAQEQDAL
jgi:hypothetical protein